MTDLADVYERIRIDPAFNHLRTPGIVLVPGEGASRPKLMIVGEAPGATENTARRPFVGASGRVLRSLITDSAELPPESYFITNVVKYRPPGNRTPFEGEIADSLPHVRSEYRVLGCPDVIVAVGATALKALAPDIEAVTRSAGRIIGRHKGRWVVPMLHPAYGLRNPAVRPQMEEHWTELGRWYKENLA